MKKMTVNLSLTIIMLALCVQTAPPIARAQEFAKAEKVASAPFNFNQAAYEERLKLSLKGRVMGYATVLLKDGLTKSLVADGWARVPGDGDVEMTTSIPALIGSTIKFTAGIALLHLLESKKERSVDEWLGMKAYTFLPNAWQETMHESIRQITLRDLLQHKGGFIHNDNLATMYDYLVKGVKSAEDAKKDSSIAYYYGKRNYANANITLLTYLIPTIASPKLLEDVNSEVKKKQWKPDNPEITKRIANEFEKYMHNEIYSRIQPGAIRPSCDPTKEYPEQNRVWAYMYAAPDDNKGETNSSKANYGFCQAQGGWYISALELAKFVANVNVGSSLVSAQTRTMIFDPANLDERLVWGHLTASDTVMARFNYERMPYQGGDQGYAHATILKLPGGYYAIGIINSELKGVGGIDVSDSTALTRRLLRAFKTGIGAPEDSKCPQLAQEIKAATAMVAPLRAQVARLRLEIKELQAEVSEPGTNPSAVKLLKATRLKLDAALAKLQPAEASLKALLDDAERRVCEL